MPPLKPISQKPAAPLAKSPPRAPKAADIARGSPLEPTQGFQETDLRMTTPFFPDSAPSFTQSDLPPQARRFGENPPESFFIPANALVPYQPTLSERGGVIVAQMAKGLVNHLIDGSAIPTLSTLSAILAASWFMTPLCLLTAVPYLLVRGNRKKIRASLESQNQRQQKESHRKLVAETQEPFDKIPTNPEQRHIPKMILIQLDQLGSHLRLNMNEHAWRKSGYFERYYALLWSIPVQNRECALILKTFATAATSQSLPPSVRLEAINALLIFYGDKHGEMVADMKLAACEFLANDSIRALVESSSTLNGKATRLLTDMKFSDNYPVEQKAQRLYGLKK